MTPPDLDRRQAQASPRDFPQDMDKEHGWQVCERCVHLFLGLPVRIRCRECEKHGAAS
jgi:hypothetical protein